MPEPQRDEGMLPDNYPSVEDEGLSLTELEAKAHWERFAPNLVENLNAQGPTALDTAIRAAWWRMEYLTRLEVLRNPGLHPSQLEELHRDELWIPPEPHATQEPLLPIIS